MADTSNTRNAHGRASAGLGARSDSHALRNLAVSVGVLWSVAFVVVGLNTDLQMYADGSLFSYAVAVQDAWAFHWHNIPGRLFVYLYAYLPSEAYVGWFGDARGGVVLYGFLFFVAPLLGLAATYAADRSENRVLFVYACASTASLCPLVFGFPTEVWVSHALFWPALALCHHGPGVRDAAGLVADACRRGAVCPGHPDDARASGNARSGVLAIRRRLFPGDGGLEHDQAVVSAGRLYRQDSDQRGLARFRCRDPRRQALP
jgi:hypothetical protein